MVGFRAMIDFFGAKAKALLAGAEARVAALEEALAYEKKRNEALNRQVIAMVDRRALQAAEAPPETPRSGLPTDLHPNPPTKLHKLGKRSDAFPGLLRAAIIARRDN